MIFFKDAAEDLHESLKDISVEERRERFVGEYLFAETILYTQANDDPTTAPFLVSQQGLPPADPIPVLDADGVAAELHPDRHQVPGAAPVPRRTLPNPQRRIDRATPLVEFSLTQLVPDTEPISLTAETFTFAHEKMWFDAGGYNVLAAFDTINCALTYVETVMPEWVNTGGHSTDDYREKIFECGLRRPFMKEINMIFDQENIRKEGSSL